MNRSREIMECRRRATWMASLMTVDSVEARELVCRCLQLTKEASEGLSGPSGMQRSLVALLSQCLDLSRKFLGDDEPVINTLSFNLGLLLAVGKQWQQALPILKNFEDCPVVGGQVQKLYASAKADGL